MKTVIAFLLLFLILSSCALLPSGQKHLQQKIQKKPDYKIWTPTPEELKYWKPDPRPPLKHAGSIIPETSSIIQRIL